MTSIFSDYALILKVIFKNILKINITNELNFTLVSASDEKHFFYLIICIYKQKNNVKLFFENQILKYVHDLKKDLREKGWWERETPEVSQTSFLRSENSDSELGFKFE